MDKMLQEVLENIKPKDHRNDEEINAVLVKINSELKKQKIKAEAMIGGSFAKDTHLAGDHDCDIFVRFDYSYKDKNISDILEKVLRPLFRPNRVHGSRDYFMFTKSLNYEIVPVIKITKPDQALNVTDASPLHVAWVRKFKKSDEIRLAKAFCKAHEIYGAESYIKGFSGHVLDILVIKYGSFMNLLKASQKWKDKQVIDVEKHHKDALFMLNASKTQGPLIVIDPIQKDRNAAAALSREKFDIFINEAKKFLKTPSKKFFEKHELTSEKVIAKAKGKELVLLRITPLEGKRDVVGAKLLKAYEYIKQNLKENEFKFASGWNWNPKEAFYYFIFQKQNLSKTILWEGPEVKNEKHADAFRKMYKKTFVKGGKLFTEKERPFMHPEDLIRKLLDEPNVKDKFEEIEWA